MHKDPIFAATIAGVQQNCHISDALYAGNYSLCVFLLKMREYYRWEKQLPQSEVLSREAVGQWMTAREQLWDTLEEEAYAPVRLGDREWDPFASATINETLVPAGLVYSSGIGVFGKPLFFIGRLAELQHLDGARIYISDEELARDLVAPPAMSLNGDIFIRRQSLRRFLWEKIEEWQWKKNPHTAMGRVLTATCADLGPEPAQLDTAAAETLLDRLTALETRSLILHEQGEISAGKSLGADWEALLAQLDSVKAEFIMRALRDLFADCLVTLPTLLENPGPALHFWFANFSGMRRALWPELADIYDKAVHSGDLAPLSREVSRGRRRWQEEALGLMAQYRRDSSQAQAYLETLCACHNIS